MVELWLLMYPAVPTKELIKAFFVFLGGIEPFSVKSKGGSEKGTLAAAGQTLLRWLMRLGKQVGKKWKVAFSSRWSKRVSVRVVVRFSH